MEEKYNFFPKLDDDKSKQKDFPGGLVVKNTPCNRGDACSILGVRTKLPHA